jgi:hypothetical protein
MQKQTTQPAVAPAHFHPLRLNFAYSDLHKRLYLPSAHVASLRNTNRPAPLTDGRKPPANTQSHCSSNEISRHQKHPLCFQSSFENHITCLVLHTLVSRHLSKVDRTTACMSSTICHSSPPASHLFQSHSYTLPTWFAISFVPINKLTSTSTHC